ncbi:hypothetical protein AAMO2058_000695900 [Amorphochlora amoebiformis]
MCDTVFDLLEGNFEEGMAPMTTPDTKTGGVFKAVTVLLNSSPGLLTATDLAHLEVTSRYFHAPRQRSGSTGIPRVEVAARTAVRSVQRYTRMTRFQNESWKLLWHLQCTLSRGDSKDHTAVKRQKTTSGRKKPPSESKTCKNCRKHDEAAVMLCMGVMKPGVSTKIAPAPSSRAAKLYLEERNKLVKEKGLSPLSLAQRTLGVAEVMIEHGEFDVAAEIVSTSSQDLLPHRRNQIQQSRGILERVYGSVRTAFGGCSPPPEMPTSDVPRSGIICDLLEAESRSIIKGLYSETFVRADRGTRFRIVAALESVRQALTLQLARVSVIRGPNGSEGSEGWEEERRTLSIMESQGRALALSAQHIGLGCWRGDCEGEFKLGSTQLQECVARWQRRLKSASKPLDSEQANIGLASAVAGLAELRYCEASVASRTNREETKRLGNESITLFHQAIDMMEDAKVGYTTRCCEMMKDLGKVYRFLAGFHTQYASLGHQWLEKSLERQQKLMGKRHPNTTNIYRMLGKSVEDEDGDEDEDDQDFVNNEA